MRKLIAVLLSLAAGCVAAADLAPAPDKVTPLLLGSELPDAKLSNIDGSPVTLREAVGGKPAVLVFYRGGWCPYCNLQLSGLRKIESDLERLGYRIVAISPDRPEELRKTLDRHRLAYALLSDSAQHAMRAFGIGYRIDAETLAKYRSFGVDLAQASGNADPALPVPAVYIADARGVLQFSYVHPDYRVRVPAEVVLAAARAIAAGHHELHPQH